ncbi:FAD:protein FMN transferase [Streptococcus parasanguinis]|uniref:FAD:protein FMN transferase n=1 Tax=Streptococcus parasanguinis TaxID=1318 RepID=UPI0039C06697
MDLSSRSEHLMGTTITVSICDPQADELLAHCFELLRSYEHRFSANNASSELMEVNHQAGIAPVQVHPDLFELIALGTLHSQAKNSHLNIAIGPLVQTWRIGFSDARRPAPEEIEQALLKIDPQQIQLDQENYTVFLKRPGMKIDLGALAKGYSADLIATYLRGKGIKEALIDLGGNILTVGQHPIKQQPWRIGIQNPVEKRGNHLLVLSVKDKSVVTSGIYERHLEVDGQSFHHIFDSATGYPVETDLASITILSDRSVDGEIWTTRLFGDSPTSILNTVESLPGIETLLVSQSGKIAYTSGLQSYL